MTTPTLEPSTRPVDRQRFSTQVAARHAVEAERVAELVAVVEPALGRDVVLTAVESSAVGRRARMTLLAWLTEHGPAALTDPTPGVPKVVARFTAALVAAGATTIRRRQPRPLAVCEVCGRQARVKDHDTAGRARCGSCRRRDTSLWQACSGCGRTRPVNARTPAGEPLCGTCYRSPQTPCSQCGKTSVIVARLALHPHQHDGQHHGQHHGQHDGQEIPADRELARRGDPGLPVCASCYAHPVRRCGRCGRTRRVAVRATATTPDLCPTCHQAPVLTCTLCSTTTLCRTTLRGPDGSKQPICFRCQLARHLDRLLTGPDGTIPAPLLGLRAAVLAADNPRTPLGWLSRGPAPRLLAGIAAGTLPLTHAALDDAAGLTGPGSHSVEHLRQLLVVTGALPDRDRHLPRLQRNLTHLIAGLPDTLPATDRQTLNAYATWHHLRRLRGRAAAGHDNVHAVHAARDAVAEAADLTVWLHQLGRALADCTQSDLDIYFAGRSRVPSRTRRLPAFLRWAAAHSHIPRALTIPDTPPHQPTVFMTAADHRRHITRLLNDDTLHVADRVTGLLVLLYAQPLARIAGLTRNDIHHDHDGVRLTLARTALRLPGDVADLVVQLPAEHPGGVARHLATDDPWLFPGRRPGQHIHPITLTHRLTDLGINARAGRNTALLELATTVPAIAIADLLGITPATAERWNALSGHRWTTYAAHH